MALIQFVIRVFLVLILGLPFSRAGQTQHGTALSNVREASFRFIRGGGSGGVVYQDPGPSSALFASPYYTCSINVYVSQSGSDTTGSGTIGNPWATLHKADLSAPAAGTCVNVVASGTAYSGVLIANGGNAATSTGYVVYRCTTLDGCTITGNAGVHSAESFETVQNVNGTPPNYLMFDGFILAGGNSSSNGVGVSVWNGNNGSGVASHHIWVLNSIINGFGQSGVGVAASEYYYVIHNTVYNNSNLQCSSQGSGIAINIMHHIPSYTATSDDQTNPNPLLGPTWVIGGQFFHNVVEYNVVYNNTLIGCSGATDGNGIIWDSNLTGNGDTENYANPSLTAFNVVYNNGGGGVHGFYSAYVWVINNTCYNNQLDPNNTGTGKACIDDSSGNNFTFLNNIAFTVLPATSTGTCFGTITPLTVYGETYLGAPATAASDTFTNNVSYRTSGSSCWSPEYQMFNSDVFSTSSNKAATNPLFVSVGGTTTGSNTSPPNGANFALQSGSAAIGYGLTETYLPAQSVDAGACYHTLTTCP